MSEDISSKVKKIVADHLGIDEAKVLDDSSFIDDLGADSLDTCLLYTSPSPRDKRQSRMPSSA